MSQPLVPARSFNDPGAEYGRELLDLLLAATNDGMVDWDLTSGSVHYSVRWKMLLGYEEHELADAPDLWKTLCHPADLPRVEELVNDHIENVWPFAHQWRMRHSNGEWRWVLCRAVAIRSSDGRARRVVSVYTDITDQVRAEERYRALANGIPDAILRIRSDGLVLDEKPGGKPLALLSGPAAGRRLHVCATDQSWVDKTLGAVATASRSGEVVVFEHGEEGGTCVEIRVVKSDENEAVCVARDITERKQAERRLVESLDRLNRTQRQLMEASHRAGMAEVASSVLHNVGNVLNSVNVSANAAREILATSRVAGLAKAVRMLRDQGPALGGFLTSDPKGQRILPYLEQLAEVLRDEGARVRKELESLQTNIDHIKAIVTMQQSHARAHRGVVESFAPADVVEDALKLIGAGAANNGFELVREYSQVGDARADRHKVLQIVTNLLSNARHALSETPHKRVTVRLTSHEPGRFAIEVEDTGCGIPEENLTRIFQYGFTTRREGHGFGLHASAVAATEMGGSLTGYSEGAGRGARFVLELPLATRRSGAAG